MSIRCTTPRRPSLISVPTNTPPNTPEKNKSNCISAPDSLVMDPSQIPEKRKFTAYHHTLAKTAVVKEIYQCLRTGSLRKTGQGENGALILIGPDEQPRFVCKFEERELGTDHSKIRQVFRGELLAERSKMGIEPGEGAFSEYLSHLLMKKWLKKIRNQVSSCHIHIPDASWGCMTHPHLTSPSLFEGKILSHRAATHTGCLHRFETDCISFSQAPKSWKETLSVETVQLFALFMLRLFNTDNHGENVLLKKMGDVIWMVPIDNACIAPRISVKQEDTALMKVCWQQLPALRKPISPPILTFIEQSTVQDLSNCLAEMQSKGIARAAEFDPARIHTYTIALHLIQCGARKGLTLYQISKLLVQSDAFDVDKPLCPIYQRHQETQASFSQLAERFVLLYAQALCGSTSTEEEALETALSNF